MVSTMPRKTGSTPGDGKPHDGKPKPAKKNLNVGIEIGEDIAKVANLRGKTIEELFDSPDVAKFFKHLLAVEIDREARRLKGQT